MDDNLSALLLKYKQDSDRILMSIANLPRDQIVAASLLALATYGVVTTTLEVGLERRGLMQDVEALRDQTRRSVEHADDTVNMVQQGDRFIMSGGKA